MIKVMSKSAMVAIVGRPSAGKSTLMNALCGEKISIVTPVPQTTRNRVRGILNDESGQIVFLDTPGFHHSEKKFNQQLMTLVSESLEDCDLVLYLIDASRRPGAEERELISIIAKVSVPVLLVVAAGNC
jgi:GTP-binding protein Era